MHQHFYDAFHMEMLNEYYTVNSINEKIDHLIQLKAVLWCINCVLLIYNL